MQSGSFQLLNTLRDLLTRKNFKKRRAEESALGSICLQPANLRHQAPGLSVQIITLRLDSDIFSSVASQFTLSLDVVAPQMRGYVLCD